MGVVRARQAGPDVEELPDARLRRQVADRPAEEAPVGAHPGHDLGPQFDDLVARRPVGREIVPDSNKGCAAGTCQHTCEAWQAPNCPHKWTVRYSVDSRQREQSFGTLTEAQTFQLTLSTGKQTQGAMFTDPRAASWSSCRSATRI